MAENFDNTLSESDIKKRRSLLLKYVSLAALLTIRPDILIEVLRERNLLNDLMNLENLDNNANRHEDSNEVSIEELLRRVREHRGDRL
ncbi:MAG: hypothetical protein L7G96_07605 [Vulcanisaeta sp.]|nr:hypothetical protein [Vulcanisaeta sp.]MCG2895179.1 hypothetical protein [Vulcanisaeta sp.]